MSIITPQEYYQSQIETKAIVYDSRQVAVLNQMDVVFQKLLNEHKKRANFFATFRTPRLVKGIYLWGGVGAGKTYLLDCFYHCLPWREKKRIHFHRFMQEIHAALKKYQGEIDPLSAVAKELAKKILVLCFDEFFVSDITDAMLLGRLLKALFNAGVCFVATSNIAPDDLYKYGLQRKQFLPAISLIKENTHIINLTSLVDYRLQYLNKAGVFYTPLNAITASHMDKTFSVLTAGKDIDATPIFIHGRTIAVKKKSSEIIWFNFRDICHIPRSQHDYLSIVQIYQIIFISDVPVIPENANDVMSLFIKLVDVLYDAKTKLIMSAEKPIADLYPKGPMRAEYARTQSRLMEMQSIDYFNEGKLCK